MYWIAVRFTKQDEDKISELRQGLFSDLPSNQYEQEEMPHITIVPGFTVDSGEKPSIEDIVSNFEPFAVNFSSYHMWPSVEEPMVVATTPDKTFSLARLQAEVLDWIGENGSLEYETTPFHMTLFKAGDAGDQPSFKCKEETRSFAERVKEEKKGLPLEATVASIGVLEWNE